MTFEKVAQVRRTIWVAECHGCGDRVEHDTDGTKERYCDKCKKWVPFKETSYLGPEIKA